MRTQTPEVIRSLFETSQNILLISHIRPDGDCIGSVLGLGLALKEHGKKIQMVLRDGVPGSFKHLPGSEEVTRSITQPYDLSVVLDCSDINRTGGVLDGKMPDINIDHHITNLNFAKINHVEDKSAATAAILAKNMLSWGLPITQDVASNLLTGIISDTIGFRTSNVTAETLRLAADLMDKGARLDRLYFQALVQRSFESLNYWGKGLTSIKREGRIVWAVLTLKDRKAADYPGNDDADLINILSTIQDCDIAMIFIEQKGGKVKVSWRAQPGWNVSQIALQFGGGGHPAAAGAEINGAIEKVEQMVIQITQTALEQQIIELEKSEEEKYPPPTVMGTD